MSADEALSTQFGDDCPGSGKPWKSGTGAPICPTCRRGPGGLKVDRPTKKAGGKFTGTVPRHGRRTS